MKSGAALRASVTVDEDEVEEDEVEEPSVDGGLAVTLAEVTESPHAARQRAATIARAIVLVTKPRLQVPGS